MSKKPVTITHTASFRDVWKIIFARHINAVPVVDSKSRLLGIITKDDVLTFLYPDYHDLFEDFLSITDFEDMENRIATLGNKKVKDIMSTRVVYTLEGTPIMRALSRMIVRRVGQLPVLAEDNVVVGMITKGDIFKSIITRQMAKNSGRHKSQATKISVHKSAKA